MEYFAEEELIVNLDVLSKDKLHFDPGDIISLSIPPTDENETRFVFCVNIMWPLGQKCR